MNRSAIIVALAAAGAAAAAPDWVQLLPAGAFAGQDGRGPWQADVTAVLAASGAGPLVIDYDHQSDLAAIEGVGGTAPAAGWIEELQARPDGLWGRVAWTDKARTAIAAREYRFLSPVFTHEADGRVLRFLRAALTNKPNLTLTALNAAAGGTKESAMDKDQLAALRKALGLTDTADGPAVVTAAQALAVKAAGLTSVAKAAGLAEGAEATAICAAVAALGKPDPAKFVPAEQVTALQSQLNSLVAAGKAEKATAAVDKAVAAGKLVPALRDWGLALHQQDPAQFEAYIAGAPVVLKPGGQVAGDPPATGDHLTAEEKAVCASLGLKPEAYLAVRKADQAAA